MDKSAYIKLINDSVKAIEDNTDLFYQQKEKEGYEMLNNTLTLLIQTVNTILELQAQSDAQNFPVQTYNEVLSDALHALEYGDTILFSDILYFDLKPLLEQSIIDYV